MSDPKYGTKAGRLRQAQAETAKGDVSMLSFLARFERPKVRDDRKYRVRSRDGDYFKKWEGTGWETVKRFAHWTRDVNESAALTLDEWEKTALGDIVSGFPASRLERV